MLKRLITGTVPGWLQAIVHVFFWMVIVDSVCIHYGADGWATFKAVFLLGPILAALGFVATVKPVWIVNKDR